MMQAMSTAIRTPAGRFAERVKRIGFRKWYERELLSSHGHLVLCILSVVAMLASFEAIRGASALEKVLDILFVIVTLAIALWSLRRFLFHSMRAEGVANQASCKDCGEYGRFTVVGEDRNPQETQVCCRKCSHLWTISQP
jgi:hypothetical protein